MEQLRATVPERALGPPLLALAVVLLALDLLIALGLRGLLRPARRAVAAVLLLAAAGSAPAHAHALDDRRANPALAHAARLHRHRRRPGGRRVAKAGLEGLSEYVNRRTAATLVEPDRGASRARPT